MGCKSIRLTCACAHNKGLEPAMACSPWLTCLPLLPIQPLTPLFTIPSTAKINIRNLKPRYPSRAATPLSATQSISLHLFLHRPPLEDNSRSLDPLFGPYISILPREFDSHPLTWIVSQSLEVGQSAVETRLLTHLPPSVKAGLTKVEARFWEDWKAVSDYLGEFPDIRRHDKDSLRDTPDFLWAWLNVNSRCLYDNLGLSRADNISLCPIFDFANHTWVDPSMDTRGNDIETWKNSPSAGRSGLTCITGHLAVLQGQEIYLTYGSHPNRTLFVEYGFVNAISEGVLTSGRYFGEADVQDVVEELFQSRGLVGVWMKEILEEEGYWGDWTLHSSPQPAHPSYRLITALRLYHLVSIGSDGRVPPQDAVPALLGPWRDTLLGLREEISEENEAAWRESLMDLCETLESRTDMATATLLQSREEATGKDWYGWMFENVRLLWWEEREVARAVALSVRMGETF